MTTHNREWILSRREFAAVPALLTGAALRGFSQTALLTAGQVVDRIKEHLGVRWRGGATDTFKTGDADTRVTGIATTVMSTFDVIKKAAAARRNMVITHEPTFWTGNDDVRGFDANTAGLRKGLILIGHWVSEDQGMRLCADWLRSFVPEVPVEWIPAGDPFWRP
jgi:hypothetical protein